MIQFQENPTKKKRKKEINGFQAICNSKFCLKSNIFIFDNTPELESELKEIEMELNPEYNATLGSVFNSNWNWYSFLIVHHINNRSVFRYAKYRKVCVLR